MPDGIILDIKNADEVTEEQERLLSDQVDLDSDAKEKELQELFKASLAGHIISEFQTNRDAKESSGIKNEIIESLQAFNGEYSNDDLQRIEEEGGSKIFMNITATKARAAKSWIADIMKPAKGKAWTIVPTPKPDLPDTIERKIAEAINREFEEAVSGQQQGQGSEGREVSTIEAQEKLRDINQRSRDVKTAIQEEINKEAQFQMDVMERQIQDQLVEGKWDSALLTFLDDFVVAPTAFMKGPVVSKGAKLQWKNGRPVPEQKTIFKNLRVDPLDIYPSPNATCINDGNLIEHLRLSASELSSLRGVKNYQTSEINKVLEESPEGTAWWMDASVESQKASQERRGNEFEANRGVFHGMHFFGPVRAETLKRWEFECKGFNKETSDDNDVVEVEAILIGSKVVKCIANSDPLLRRPYYKASFMNRSGSFWGRSLPNLMKDIQRMCNATSRALANNLGVASGPFMEVEIDRLASNDSIIEEIRPRMIVQTKSNPMSGTGRAVNWFQPTSNAAELLAVYEKYEQRADDVTGIPRYAYGNESLAGAATTLGGLSMLLESASKIIKDAIRNIDEGLIKPRVEQQFYINLLENKSNFSGDITVVPIGSSVLSMKAFEALRRNEFLAVTANQFDQETMGPVGRASILRKSAEDIGLDVNVIPTEFELKEKAKQTQAAQEQAQQLELEEAEKDRQASIMATTVQIEGQKGMAQGAQALQKQDITRKALKDQADVQLDASRIEADKENVNKEIALKAISPDHKGI
jgi:hypothetical protein